MTDNTAAIADAQARERASDLAQQSVTGRTDDECASAWEPTQQSEPLAPARVYVAWAGQNPRFWSVTPPADMHVTTYVVQSELDAVTEDRDLWHQSEQVCGRQFSEVQAEFMEALNILESTIDLGHSMESEGQAIDAAREFLTKHGRLT